MYICIYSESLPHLCPEIFGNFGVLLKFQRCGELPPARISLQTWNCSQAIQYRHPDSPSHNLRSKAKTKHLFSENLKDPSVQLFLVWPLQAPEVVGCCEATSWGTGLMTHRGCTLRRGVHSPCFFVKTLSDQFPLSLFWPQIESHSPP